MLKKIIGLKFFIILTLAVIGRVTLIFGETSPGPFINGAFPKTQPLSELSALVQIAYPKLTDFEGYIAAYPIPRQNKMALVLRKGKIYTFDDDENASEAKLILDISDRIFRPGREEYAAYNVCALYSIAFHPEFNLPDSPNRNFCYIFYTHNIDNQVFFQLSRFERNEATQTLDPETELVLIRHKNSGDNAHVGNELFFDNEGFLNISIGDLIEAGESLPWKTEIYEDTQRIDRIFNACLLRIDVDRDPKRSHPIKKTLQARPGLQEKTSMSEKHVLYSDKNFSGFYFIPNNNPFVDADGALEEYFAIGMRNPYKVSFDQQTSKIMCGDVGSNLSMPYEEVYEVKKGGNHGWAFEEGPGQTEVSSHYKSMKKAIAGDFIPPNHFYDHSVGNCVIGGSIYRGEEIPNLVGKYIFGDWTSRAVWAMDFSDNKVVKIATFPGKELRSFGRNHRGDILLLGYDGKIHKLAKVGKRQNAEESLAKIKLPLTNNADNDKNISLQKAILTGKIPEYFIPYEINSPLWMGGAGARRWLFLPSYENGGESGGNGKIGFTPNSAWSLPVGSVVIKHIEVPSNEEEKSFQDVRNRQPIETQVLVLGEDNVHYGLAYKWEWQKGKKKGGGYRTSLITEFSDKKEFEYLEAGVKRKIDWKYNNPSSCIDCHKANVGGVLGLKTFQLNRDILLSGGAKKVNQLDCFFSKNMFSNFDKNLVKNNVDRNALDFKVKSWLASNCSYCHNGQKGSAGRAMFDLSYGTRVVDSGLFGNPIIMPLLGQDSKLLVAGNPEKSLLFYRASSNVPGIAMPVNASFPPDSVAIENLRNWIKNMGEDIFLRKGFMKVAHGVVTEIPLDGLVACTGELNKKLVKIVSYPKYGKISYDVDKASFIYEHGAWHREADGFSFRCDTVGGVKSEVLDLRIGIWGRKTWWLVCGFGIVLFLLISIFAVVFLKRLWRFRN